MSNRFEQPPIDALAELQVLTKKRRELVEKAATGATTPEESEQALREAEEMLPELEERRSAIREKLWPFTELTKENVETQYNQEIAALESSGVLVRLKNGEQGINGIDGKEYPLPTIQQVVERLRGKKDIVEQKAKQGLLKIQLTPMAINLDSLRQSMAKQSFVIILPANSLLPRTSPLILMSHLIWIQLHHCGHGINTRMRTSVVD